MSHDVSNDSVDKPLIGMPKSARPPASAGPQGTRMYEGADLERIRSRLVTSIKVATRQPSLLGVSLPFTGRRFPLQAGSTTIGRATENDIVLDEPGVSSMHAKIIHEEGGWRVMNLLSTNGTFVNGKKQTVSSLKPGDRVRFGRTEFLFDYDDKSLPASAGAQRITLLRLLGWLAVGAALLAMVAVCFMLI